MFSDELRQKHPCFKKGRSDFQFYNHVKADPSLEKKVGATAKYSWAESDK